MSDKKTRRESPAVNAGSMADIAFLLLIFFLVTTTIQEDKGVLVRLPVWDDAPISEPINENNVLTVIINSADQLLVENEPATIASIPVLLADHVISPLRKPTNAVVSLTHDRGTSYASYLAVYDALKLGYKNIWDEAANREFGKAFDLLEIEDQRNIRNTLPMVISEAEPSDILGS
ncbi:biopolymer transporter ExbD [Neolewinella aurantiaca]|uniref:Biopolymer transporter ExbD n=1 Tax=Neolewinella aurantiaca TaxID=2602767 RepID=A0A5C7FVS3_9BACT|nr:biopolymer transporter ExbD [Neolewinella aurantiaca]TXF90747.1 biopolymer transporter ExbD [Neolewinella aurantiaca]